MRPGTRNDLVVDEAEHRGVLDRVLAVFDEREPELIASAVRDRVERARVDGRVCASGE